MLTQHEAAAMTVKCEGVRASLRCVFVRKTYLALSQARITHYEHMWV